LDIHAEYYQNNSLGQDNYYLGNYVTTQWAGNSTYVFNNGSYTISSSQPSSTDISYNGSLAGQPGGIFVNSGNSVISFSLKFEYYMKDNFSGSPSVNIIGEELNPSTVNYFKGWNFNASHNAETFDITGTLPPQTRYFGFRIGFYSMTGSVVVKYINFTYMNGAIRDAMSPLGSYFSAANETFNFGSHFKTGYLIVNSSNVNQLNMPSLQFQLDKFGEGQSIHLNKGTQIFAVVLVNGSLNNLSSYYAVFNSQFYGTMRVVQNGKVLHFATSGIDGSYIFSARPGNQTFEIIYLQNLVYVLYIIYALTVVYIFTVLSYSLGLTRKLWEKLNSSKIGLSRNWRKI
jgi:hypothetical protein